MGNLPEKIEYEDSAGKSHTCFVRLLKQKAGAQMMHRLLQLFGGAESAAVKSESNTVLAMLRNVDFDTIWSMACELYRYSTVDSVEVKDLDVAYETPGLFGPSHLDLYSALFAALGANFPDFFGRSGGSTAYTSVQTPDTP